ncbi:hypothetical protein DFJ73DRAFT_913790, partial [Zopfochytrium polystomum]
LNAQHSASILLQQNTGASSAIITPNFVPTSTTLNMLPCSPPPFTSAATATPPSPAILVGSVVFSVPTTGPQFAHTPLFSRQSRGYGRPTSATAHPPHPRGSLHPSLFKISSGSATGFATATPTDLSCSHWRPQHSLAYIASPNSSILTTCGPPLPIAAYPTPRSTPGATPSLTSCLTRRWTDLAQARQLCFPSTAPIVQASRQYPAWSNTLPSDHAATGLCFGAPTAQFPPSPGSSAAFGTPWATTTPESPFAAAGRRSSPRLATVHPTSKHGVGGRPRRGNSTCETSQPSPISSCSDSHNMLHFIHYSSTPYLFLSLFHIYVLLLPFAIHSCSLLFSLSSPRGAFASSALWAPGWRTSSGCPPPGTRRIHFVTTTRSPTLHAK